MCMSFVPNGSEFLSIKRNADPVALKCHRKVHPSVGYRSQGALCERAHRFLVFGREEQPSATGVNSKYISTRQLRVVIREHICRIDAPEKHGTAGAYEVDICAL